MQFGQPPSWRPDHDQLRAEACRGTVRDALGGLRNLEQLLGSLRVGPRALLSVLPDVQGCCSPLAEALCELAMIVATKLDEARTVITDLAAFAQERIRVLSDAFDGIGKTTFNAKARLRLEEVVSTTARNVEAVFELIDLLGEVAWGRAMPISITELAREAFRSTEPPVTSRGAVRLMFTANITNDERELCPRALVLMLNQLARFGADGAQDGVLRIEFRETREREIALTLNQSTLNELKLEAFTDAPELRWAPGTYVLPETEQCLRIAAAAMRLRLEIGPRPRDVRLTFDAASGD